jgi:hypothetical protein
MASLVVQNPKGGMVMFSQIEQIIEVDDDFGYKLLSEYGDMLELVKERKKRIIKEEEEGI